MKKLIFVLPFLSFLLSIHVNLDAQSTESEISKDFYKADPYISIIINYLPKGWTLSVTESEFSFESGDTVWVLDENRINAPMEVREDQIKRIQSAGHRLRPKLVISYEPKWTIEQTQRAMIQNAALDDQISKLPERMHIAHLYNQRLSTKQGEVYTARDEKDRELLEKYEKEKSILSAKKLRLPDFSTQHYSLFIKEIIGASDDMHHVYPEQPSVELFTILSTFREICGK